MLAPPAAIPQGGAKQAYDRGHLGSFQSIGHVYYLWSERSKNFAPEMKLCVIYSFTHMIVNCAPLRKQLDLFVYVISSGFRSMVTVIIWYLY